LFCNSLLIRTAELPGDERLENIRVTIQAGSFSEFLEATGNVELVSLDEPDPDRVTERHRTPRALPRPVEGAKYLFADLLARIPGIRAHLEEAFARTAQCFAGNVWLFGRAVDVSIRRDRSELPPPGDLARLLRLPDNAQIVGSHDAGVEFAIPVSQGQEILERTPYVIESLGAGQTIVAPFEDGWCLSDA
jgi:hypothetical protein